MNKGLDSSITYEMPVASPGGGSAAPTNKLDSTMREVFDKPSASNPPGSHHDPEVSKPETSDIINSVFYDPQVAKPATLDSTMREIEDINFRG